MKFKVLRGTCCLGERDTKTNKLVTYRQGNIIETNTDLVALHGREKFEKMPDDTPVTRTSAKATSTSPQETSGYTAKELEGMSVEELKRLAAEEEIDLGNLSKKNDIIARIVSAGSAVPA